MATTPRFARPYRWIVGLIRADVQGLSALAASCQEQAAVVSGASAMPRSTVSPQATPTTAAIATAQADVSAAGTRFALRMQSSATSFSSAATGFAETETGSTTALEQVV
jgi:hypothetical protein